MNKRHPISKQIILTLIVILLMTPAIKAQSISIDRGVRAEGLWCFPLSTDSTTFLYLPDRGTLATDDDHKPEFSFIRYVNEPDNKEGETDQTITKAGGGAVLHFLVTYDTDQTKIDRAETKLRELLPGQPVRIKGPVIFKEGRYALVSSIIKNGKEEKNLLSVGAAPVLQGSRIALSFEIDPDRSKLLLQSLTMPTPDISIIFDMTFSGLMDAYKAKLTVDWALVHKAELIDVGFKIYYVGAELELEYEKMRRSGAIKLETEGEDAKMQQIVEGAYAKLIEVMFQKIEPGQVPAGEQDPLSSLLKNVSSGKFFPFGAHATYKKKNIQTSGTSVMNFNSRSSTDRHHYITFNIGDFYKKYGQSDEYIKTISLFDPDFQVRQIAVGVDGSLLPEFDKMINNVTVKLRKVHQNGTVTLKEVNIIKQLLNKGSNIFLSYGSVGDTDRMAWLNYEYNAQFSFMGGKMWETGWQQQNSAMINLLTPYERREIILEADADSLNTKNVRATIVKVEYPFFDGIKRIDATLMTGQEISGKKVDITLPLGQYSYKYSIRWQLKNGSVKTANGESEMGILFLDAVPEK
ncbi:MAG: hypothetical protein ACT4OJ_04605 [Bacteroidota bacterium]